MKNFQLPQDYLKRCHSRLKALEVLYAEKSWPDVVRESQEVVELALKALLRISNIEIPRIHDVGQILLDNKDRVPEKLRTNLQRFAKISKNLRRDRELAFYGGEDLTPLDFYSEEDAREAQDGAKFIVETISKNVKI